MAAGGASVSFWEWKGGGALRPSQVARDYDGEIQTAIDEGRSAREVDDLIAARRDRQANYLKRKPDRLWRPKKKHRVAARSWVRMLDNVLRSSTDDLSLQKMVVDEDEAKRGPPLGWPKVHVAMDLESCGISAMNWLLRVRHCNVGCSPDPSHGVHNGVNEAIKCAGLHTVQRLLLLCRNLESGPYHEDIRYGQLCESWKETWSNLTWRDCPVFQDMVPLILQDRDLGHRIGDPAVMDELWQELADDPPYRRKTPETNTGRFLTSIREGLLFKKSFHLRLFTLISLCLEMDWLRGTHLAPLLEQLSRGTQSVEGEPGAAMRKGPQAVEALLRRSTANALVAATVWMLDEQTPRSLRVMNAVNKPWLGWHQRQNKTLRSADGSLTWLKEQVGGEYLETVAETWRCLQEPRVMRYMLLAPSAGANYMAADEGEIEIDNENCSMAASLVLHLCRIRLRWGLRFLRGWPDGSAAFLLPDDRAEAAMQQLKQDYANYQRVVAEGGCSVTAELGRRSSFHLPSVQQHLVTLQQSNYKRTEEYMKWLSQDCRRLVGTQVVEDSFNRESAMVRKQVNRRSRVMRQWKKLLERGVLNKVHHYHEYMPRAPKFKSRFLPNEAFQPHNSKCSIDLEGLASTTPSPDWYAPVAARMHVEHADLEFIDILCAENKIDMAEHIWHNSLLELNGLLLRKKSQPPGPYFLAVGSWGDTASPVWPMERHTSIRGEVYYVPATEAPKRLTFVALLNLAEWEGLACSWKGPRWQRSVFKALVGGVVAIPAAASEPRPLLELAALQAFAEMPLATIKHFGTSRGIESPMDSLSTTLMAVVMDILKCSEEEALDIVRVRCSRKVDASTEAFMSLDAGLEIFSKSDEQDLRKEQETTKARVNEASDFRQEYAARRSSGRPPEPKAKAKAKALARDRRREWCPDAPTAIPDGFIEHAEAKKMLPPGALIWRRLTVGGWQCHYKPYPRASFNFRRWTPRGSMVLCLQHCWRHFLTDQGLTEESCPIEGLFAEQFEPLS